MKRSDHLLLIAHLVYLITPLSLTLTALNLHMHCGKKRGGTQGEVAMRPVMTMTIHIGYTEGSLSRELSLPGGPVA
jgi:hypothetical protein